MSQLAVIDLVLSFYIVIFKRDKPIMTPNHFRISFFKSIKLNPEMKVISLYFFSFFF